MSETSPATLAYADVPYQWGITVERTADGLMMTVPPVPNFSSLSPHYLWGLFPLTMTVLLAFSISKGAHGLFPSIILYGGIDLIILYRLARAMRVRKIIVVDRNAVSVRSICWRQDDIVTWPRDKVFEVKRNSFSGKLLFRITGEQMPEIFISRNRKITEWVAKTVSNVIFAEHHAKADATVQIADSTNSGPQLRQLTMKAMFTFIGLIFISGLVLALFWKSAGLAIAIFWATAILSAIACGAVFGTQDKEYWF